LSFECTLTGSAASPWSTCLKRRRHVWHPARKRMTSPRTTIARASSIRSMTPTGVPEVSPGVPRKAPGCSLKHPYHGQEDDSLCGSAVR
jgi:hypothetical protein